MCHVQLATQDLSNYPDIDVQLQELNKQTIAANKL